MGGKGENTNNGGLFYNYVTDPTEPGSNGIYEDVDNPEETIGGGVLNFDVSGTTTIDGNAKFLSFYNLSLVVRKPVFGVSDQVRHKPGCTATDKMARGLKFRI